jgi:hypothetical protein
MITCYGIAIAAIAATRLHLPGVPTVVAAHLAIPLLPWLAARQPDTRFGRAMRASYPLLLLTGLYSALDLLNGSGAAATYDRFILNLEEAIFGNQPSRDWWRNSPSRFWSTVLHAVYFSYYFLIPLPVVAWMSRRRSDMIGPYLDCVIATFLICYLFYLLIPVAGPYYEFARPAGDFVANLPARLVYAGLSKGSAYGAAFPSSHVAATVAATLTAWRHDRALGTIMAVPTAMLTVGVVYCQMHYVIDSVAGVVVGVAVPLVVAALHRRFGP